MRSIVKIFTGVPQLAITATMFVNPIKPIDEGLAKGAEFIEKVNSDHRRHLFRAEHLQVH